MRPVLTFHFVTLFPETIRVWLSSSILGRAHEAGLFDFKLYQLRDYVEDKHRTVDDMAYGGGGGMVLKVEPLVRAVESVRQSLNGAPSRTLYFSPGGRPLSQQVVHELSLLGETHHLILICGHYEGVDQRFLDHWVDEEISLGDFVLTGGELPAVALADALIRRVDGVLGLPSGSDKESFTLFDDKGVLLEYPHYTRPQSFRGLEVPSALLSGNHQLIQNWRMEKARERTSLKRPDLKLPQTQFDKPKA